MMAPRDFRTLIQGAVKVWNPQAILDFDMAGLECRIASPDGNSLTIKLETQPFGTVWRLSAPRKKERVHLSVVPALRGMRASLCPDRPAGRVLFVSGDHGD